MATLEQAGARPPDPVPGFWWRVLSPIGAVLAAFILLVVSAGALSLTAISDDALESILVFSTSLLLLVFAVLLWLGLPAMNRRAVVAVKGSLPGVIVFGIAFGIALVFGAGLILLAGSAIDSNVERRLDEVESIGTAPWQLVLTVTALVVLAPLGEELLFRGLLLRGLARRLPFWAAAVISSLLFASAHADVYVLWPRAIALVGTGFVLALIYRRFGYWGSVSAHATVNVVAAIALVASS